MKKLLRQESGQTLIEAIVALSALIISLAGISIAVIFAVNNTTFVKNQNLANKYAQAGMEYFKNKAENGETVNLNPPIQNKSEDDFRNLSGTYCLGESFTIATYNNGCIPANVGETFQRYVTFTQSSCGPTPTPDDLGDTNQYSGSEVTVTVSWSSSKCPSDNTYCHKAQLHSCFSKDTNSSL